MYYRYRDDPLIRVTGVINFRADHVSDITDNTDNSFDKKVLSNDKIDPTQFPFAFKFRFS